MHIMTYGNYDNHKMSCVIININDSYIACGLKLVMPIIPDSAGFL